MENNWDKPWLRSTFSENDGTGSTVRLCLFLIVFVSLLILGYLAISKPDVFIGCLGLLTAFDVAVCGPLYGLNKAGNAADTWLAAKQSASGEPEQPAANKAINH